MKKRINSINEHVYGLEPKPGDEVLTNAKLGELLNWYNKNKESKDAQKYALDFIKKKLKLNSVDLVKNVSTTFGFVCRIVTNGGILPSKNQDWFDQEIESLKNKAKLVVKEVTPTATNVVSIQERVKNKTGECIAELESLFDDVFVHKTTSNVSPFAVMTKMEMKGAHVRFISEHFKKRRKEFEEVSLTTDKDLKEGYSNFSKTELKKAVAFFDNILLDATKLSGEVAKNRKPRKRKPKTADQITSKVKYCKESDGMISVDPKSIIGSTQLLVYNKKYRKIGLYFADDLTGFSFKGTTLQNFSIERSVQKTVRKPEEFIPQIVKAGKASVKTMMKGLKAKESALTGRINEEVILLKAIK